MNTNVHIDISMNIDIIPPPTLCPPTASAWGGGAGAGDINRDTNMNIGFI